MFKKISNRVDRRYKKLSDNNSTSFNIQLMIESFLGERFNFKELSEKSEVGIEFRTKEKEVRLRSPFRIISQELHSSRGEMEELLSKNGITGVRVVVL